VKAVGARVPEVWYSSPYCAPESEVARGNQDCVEEEEEEDEEEEKEEGKRKKKKAARVWVSVETATDSWALGILTYAMLTGTHPWAQTAGDCRAYRKYREWVDGAGEEEEEDEEEEKEEEEDGPLPLPPSPAAVAPQFACFTAPARRFFRTLLDPRPRRRGRPEGALRYLGGEWVMEEERKRLEEERKRLEEERKRLVQDNKNTGGL